MLRSEDMNGILLKVANVMIIAEYICWGFFSLKADLFFLHDMQDKLSGGKTFYFDQQFPNLMR